MDWADVWEQRRSVKALGAYVARSLVTTLASGQAGTASLGRGSSVRVRAQVNGPSRQLVRHFVAEVKGDAGVYRDRVPAHMFPQWCLPSLLAATRSLSYPAWAVINAGASYRSHRPLPYGRYEIEAEVLRVEPFGRRTQVTIEVTTACEGELCISAELHVLVAGAASREAKPRPKPSQSRPRLIPLEARELWYGPLDARAGFRFAVLSGDFNPIHWSALAAKGAGFQRVLLHGFGSLSRAVEALAWEQRLTNAEPSWVNARFVRPLLLPATVGVYASGNQLFLGDAPGGFAYVEGEFELA